MYIDDVLSLNKSKISEFIDLICPCELEIKDMTVSSTSASHLDCYLCIDNGQLVTRLYDKRDNFNFPIVNFPFLSSSVPKLPLVPAYRVYVSQLVHYASACCKYQEFVDRRKQLTNKLLSLVSQQSLC